MTNLAPRGSCELTSTLRVPLAVHSPVIRNPTPVMSCQDNFHVESARRPAAAGRRLRSNLAERGSGGCDPKGCHLLDQILAVNSELVRLGLFAGDFLVRRGALDDVLTSLNKRGGHLVELGLTTAKQGSSASPRGDWPIRRTSRASIGAVFEQKNRKSSLFMCALTFFSGASCSVASSRYLFARPSCR